MKSCVGSHIFIITGLHDVARVLIFLSSLEEMRNIVCCEVFIHYSDRCAWKYIITKTRSIVHSGRLSTFSLSAGCDPFIDFQDVAVAKRIESL